MGETASVFKTLLIPAAISLALYVTLSYVLYPLYQRYNGRYGRYIPLGALTSRTTSIRNRVADGLARIVVPSSWRAEFNRRQLMEDMEFNEDDGEELFEVDEVEGRSVREGRDDGGRLSRDLEEGFRDDSDESESEAREQRQR